MVVCDVQLMMLMMVVGVGVGVVGGATYYPAIFIFGDSLTDSGNNNHLRTLAKASRQPYGRDFPSGMPTGRFCNGPLSTDYLATLAGLPYPPPYLSTSEDDILQGVTFASASSGILNSSGDIFGEHIALSKQVTYFASAKEVIVQKLGIEKAMHIVSHSLFYISIGSNDYLEGYLALGSGSFLKSPLQLLYTPSQFVELLQSNLERHVVELYKMGARKFALVGLSVLGCLPFELFARRSKGGKCIESINSLTHAYNIALMKRMRQLQSTYLDARFTYLNTYDFLNNIVQNPSSYGFDNANTACCGSGPYRAIPCIKNVSSICMDATRYVFWDFVHPTSSLNEKIANTFWAGLPPNVQPYNLKQLASL